MIHSYAPASRYRALGWLALFALLGSAVVRVVSVFFLDESMSDHIEPLADLSLALIVLGTWLIYVAMWAAMRRAEARWNERHAELEEEWRQRHARLLAREQEILDQMREARAALGIPEPRSLRVVQEGEAG